VEWYQENGPSVLAGVELVHSSNSFRMDGFLALLVGQDVPYQKRYEPTPAEREFWRKYRGELVVQAKRGMTSEEVLKILHAPGTQWS
jgi:tryptophan halogenase